MGKIAVVTGAGRGAGKGIAKVTHSNLISLLLKILPDPDPTRGPILGRNPGKNLKSFPSCYSKSSLQLCLESYISSNSRNLLQFLLYH